MKNKKCQIGGPLQLNPNNPYATALPGFGGIDYQSLMDAHPVTGVIPGMSDQTQSPYTLDKKWQFGLNYGHIATSNFLQAAAAGLRRQRQERDFNSYNQAQSNPLLQIPFNPNTTNASLYGQPLMKKGGLTADKAKEMLKDGTANGKKLTKKQKAYFGLVASGKNKYQEGGDVFGLDEEIENDIMMDPSAPVQLEQEAPESVIQAPEEDYSDALQVQSAARLAYMSEPTSTFSLDSEEDPTEITTMPTPSKPGGTAIEDFKNSIAASEGAGYFMPTQIKGKDGKPASSAYGKYQFVKGTREQVRKQFFSDIPVREFENMYKTSPMFQEQVMDAYSGYLLNKYGGDKRKAATAFFLGEGKADKSSDLNYRPTEGNSTLGQYFNRGNFQKGGEVKQFFKDYINSPKYTERLKKQGHENIPDIISHRLAHVGSVEVVNANEADSQYFLDGNMVVLSDKDIQKNNFNKNSLLAHEFSHAVGSLDFRHSRVPSTLKLNKNETKEINDRDILLRKEEPKDSEEASNWRHDTKPYERKSDIDALRYMLKKDGIYDAGTQNFNQEILNKAKKKYAKDNILNRNFKGFSDKDLIYLMNNIAYQEGQGLPIAQQGGIIKRDYYLTPPKKGGTYEDSLEAYNDVNYFRNIIPKNEGMSEGPVQKNRGSMYDKLIEKHPNIRPTSALNVDGVSLLPLYKKPVQPYVLEGKPKTRSSNKNSYEDSLRLYNSGKKQLEDYWQTTYTDKEYMDRTKNHLNFWSTDYNTTLKEKGLMNDKIKPIGFVGKADFPVYRKPTIPKPPREIPTPKPVKVNYNTPEISVSANVQGQTLPEQTGPYGITWPTFNQVDGHGQQTANFANAAQWNAAKKMLGTPQSSTETGNSGTALYPSKPSFKQGGMYFLSDKQIAELRKQGYEIEE